MSSIFTKVSITGLKALEAKFKALSEETKGELSSVIYESAFKIQAEAKRSIQKSPADPVTGRSMPGNAPKTDTGRLVNSIYVKATASGAQVDAVLVGTDLVYGRHLEFGTTNIAPRPWLYPASRLAKRMSEGQAKKRLNSLFKKIAKLKIGGAA